MCESQNRFVTLFTRKLLQVLLVKCYIPHILPRKGGTDAADLKLWHLSHLVIWWFKRWQNRGMTLTRRISIPVSLVMWQTCLMNNQGGIQHVGSAELQFLCCSEMHHLLYQAECLIPSSWQACGQLNVTSVVMLQPPLHRHSHQYGNSISVECLNTTPLPKDLGSKNWVTSYAFDPFDCGWMSALFLWDWRTTWIFPLFSLIFPYLVTVKLSPWKGRRRIAAAWLWEITLAGSLWKNTVCWLVLI